ncbi:MAG TPA: NAD(P)-dependent oxidoreductase [Candidatus Melainabacteria bacterium]|nr:NAD(P)-dependent oxidoreductase [Candidatus Melainabacteria bacterium]
MSKVLITGASGFVGANLARRMLKDGHQVSIILREESQSWRLDDISNELDVIKLNLLDFEQVLKSASEKKFELIFHLAVCGAYSWQTDWTQIVNTNLTSTINLVEACAKVGFECFVNTGSSSEYGFYDHAPKEEEPVEPNSYYAITKAAATMTCRFVAARDKLRIPTLRLYSVFGPYEDPRRLMPTLINRGRQGELPPLVDPSIARDYIYVDDVVEAFLKAVQAKDQEPGAVYNVGTGIQTSMKEIVEIAREVLTIEAEPSWGSMENRVWDSSVWVADNEKIRKELSWEPEYSLKEGFRSFSNWMDNLDALETVKKRYLQSV